MRGETEMKNITYLEAKYLKHSAQKLTDLKVSYEIWKGNILIHIADFEFLTFDSALRFIQNQEMEIAREPQTKLEVA